MTSMHETSQTAYCTQLLPQPLLPLIKRLEELRPRRVALPSLNKARRAVPRECVVHESRNALVRVHPVAVPAAKHRELHVRERPRVLHALEPAHEVPCVVRRETLEGRGDDDDGAALGQVRGHGVERVDRRTEACTSDVSVTMVIPVHTIRERRDPARHTVRGRVRGEPLRERLRAPGIRPVQDEQRLHVRRLRLRRTRPSPVNVLTLASRGNCGRERGRGDREQAGLVLARDRVDVELVGLDGERLLDLELVRGVVHDEVEALQDRDERDLRLLPGERPAL